MALSVQHTIKWKGYPSIKFTSKSQLSNLNNIQKIKDRFDEGCGSDEEPGPFCDMGDPEDNQYFMRAIYLIF